MNISEFTNISNFLRSKTIPNDLATKSDRLIFKRRASSYQLGEGDKLLKVRQTIFILYPYERKCFVSFTSNYSWIDSQIKRK